MGIMPLFLLENDKPVSCVVTVFLIFLNVMLCLYLFFFFANEEIYTFLFAGVGGRGTAHSIPGCAEKPLEVLKATDWVLGSLSW